MSHKTHGHHHYRPSSNHIAPGGHNNMAPRHGGTFKHHNYGSVPRSHSVTSPYPSPYSQNNNHNRSRSMPHSSSIVNNQWQKTNIGIYRGDLHLDIECPTMNTDYCRINTDSKMAQIFCVASWRKRIIIWNCLLTIPVIAIILYNNYVKHSFPQTKNYLFTLAIVVPLCLVISGLFTAMFNCCHEPDGSDQICQV